MKKIILILLITFFSIVLSACNTQKKEINISSETRISQSEEYKIELIKNNYSQIQNYKNFKTETHEIFWESTEWWSYTTFKDNNNLIRKIIVEYFWEIWKTQYEFYYFDNWELSFVLEQNFEYTQPIYTEWFDSNKFSLTENRYYFFWDKLIQKIDNDKNIVKTDTQKETELLKNSKDLINNI